MLGLCCCTQASSSCSKQEILSSFSAWASHSTDFSCCRAQALGHAVAVCGFSTCSPWAWLPHGKWNLPGPGIQLMCPALADGLPTTGLPGKPPASSCETVTYSWILARTRWVCEWGRWVCWGTEVLDDRPPGHVEAGEGCGRTEGQECPRLHSRNSRKCIVLRWVGESCFLAASELHQDSGDGERMIFVIWVSHMPGTCSKSHRSKLPSFLELTF